MHVKDLFCPGTRIWDPGLLERNFLPWEAKMIKVIHVSEGLMEDQLTWPLTSNGNYSVRSAYRMLMDEVSSQEPSTSSSKEFQQVWKGIWKIWTPKRICHFIWYTTLPVEDTCKLCGDFQETTLHSLWLYEYA